MITPIARFGRTAYQNKAASADMAPKRKAHIRPLPPWRLKRVMVLIDQHFSETLTLADLAAAAGVSKMHFAAQFRAATGMRPHQYLLAHRVSWAVAQMASGKEPLSILAISAGFRSQSQFTTVFRRITGITPAAWKMKALKERSANG